MISRVGAATTALGLAVVTLGLNAPTLEAQGAQRGNCTLYWVGNPESRSVSVREGEDAHVTYVSGGMTWTCGTATMVADSAVKFDLARRVELIGNVRYRDTIRTLESVFLTYYEVQDLVVATDSVHLTRLGDGSTLTGPRVEFLRAVSGVDEETIATGRPHMVLYPEGDDPGPPFDVDADRAIFAGEEEARAYGEVVITRPDLHAEADSAFFRIPDGTGTLFGSPWVEAEDIRLSGDTIRTLFEENTLREVHAVGHGHAVGESFEVRSDRIDITVEAEEVDAVWAYGDGRAEAVSAEHHLYGDSLRFAMWAGQLDTIVAVGEAAAVQGSAPARLDGESDSEEPEAPARPGDEAAGEETPDPQAIDPAAGETEPAPDPGAVDSTAVSREAAEAGAEEPSQEPPDPEVEVRPEELDPEAAAPEAAAPGADPEAAEGEAQVPGDPSSQDPGAREGEEGESVGQGAPEEGSEQPRGSGYPRLDTDDRSNWVTGDTLYAIFARSIAADDTAGLRHDSLNLAGVAVDSLVLEPIEGDSLVVVAPGSDTLPVAPTAADTAADPVLERLTVIGRARSFYAQVRDSTVTDRASRNYMIGQRIDIFFRDGEPERVNGVNAIGLYLDPTEDQEGGGTPPDSSVVPVAEDTTAAPGDTISTAPPPDTTAMAVGRTALRKAARRPSSSAGSTPFGRPDPFVIFHTRGAGRRTTAPSLTTDPSAGSKRRPG